MDNIQQNTSKASSKKKSLDQEIEAQEERLKKLREKKKEQEKRDKEKATREVESLIKSEKLNEASIQLWRENLSQIKILLGL
jgi:Spy/CpxP family protein refolding chaperone